MSLQMREPEPVDLSFPRVSGDEPYIQTCVQVAAEFSPRERG